MNLKSLIIVPLAVALSSAPLAIAQTSGAADASASTGAAAGANARDDKTIQDLLAAAQRLREAIQAMAQAPAGPKRTDAIKEGNQALLDTQRAMAALPDNLLLADANETDYQKAMDKLKRASQRLRDAEQALAKEPAGKRRNDAIKQINQALTDTNQVMMYVPPAAVQSQKEQGKKSANQK